MEKRSRNTDTVLPSLPTSTPAEGETEAVLTETPPQQWRPGGDPEG
jgi:hypothetical protein